MFVRNINELEGIVRDDGVTMRDLFGGAVKAGEGVTMGHAVSLRALWFRLLLTAEMNTVIFCPGPSSAKLEIKSLQLRKVPQHLFLQEKSTALSMTVMEM